MRLAPEPRPIDSMNSGRFSAAKTSVPIPDNLAAFIGSWQMVIHLVVVN